MNVAELLQQAEGKTLEFKRDLSSTDRVLHSIIAFANTAGGTLIVGVDDHTKHVRGVADPLKEQDRLANLVSDCIAPRLVSTQQLADALGISARAMRARMAALVERGLVTVVGGGARDPRRKYHWNS